MGGGVSGWGWEMESTVIQEKLSKDQPPGRFPKVSQWLDKPRVINHNPGRGATFVGQNLEASNLGIPREMTCPNIAIVNSSVQSQGIEAIFEHGRCWGIEELYPKLMANNQSQRPTL